MAKTREYFIWMEMKQRCNNRGHRNYKDYGGRGITVCERWMESYANFMEDMGPRPSRNHSLERIKNHLGYCKANCKWATKREQNANKRNNRLVTAFGRTMIAMHWMDEPECAIPRHRWPLLFARLDLGWEPERAISTPPSKDYEAGGGKVTDVLRLHGEGKSPEEIAEILGIGFYYVRKLIRQRANEVPTWPKKKRSDTGSGAAKEIMRLTAEGKSIPEIVRTLGISKARVSQVRKEWRERGLA